MKLLSVLIIVFIGVFIYVMGKIFKKTKVTVPIIIGTTKTDFNVNWSFINGSPSAYLQVKKNGVEVLNVERSDSGTIQGWKLGDSIEVIVHIDPNGGLTHSILQTLINGDLIMDNHNLGEGSNIITTITGYCDISARVI